MKTTIATGTTLPMTARADWALLQSASILRNSIEYQKDEFLQGCANLMEEVARKLQQRNAFAGVIDDSPKT